MSIIPPIAEEPLEDAPGLANAIVNTIREPLLVLDAKWRIKGASPSFYRVFQVPPQETLDRVIYEIGNRQWEIPALHKLLEGLLPIDGEFNDFSVEHDFPHIGPRTMLLNARRMRDDDKTDLILLAIEDVTLRRAAEDRLGISEIRYRRLFEAAHDGILILDVTTRRITDVNPFLLNLLDYPRGHFLGKELWEIGMFKDRAASEMGMHSLNETGALRYENLPLLDRNGWRRPVEVVANIYQEGDEQVIQCNIRDISQRERLDNERHAYLMNEQALRMEAEAANSSKDMFLATLSHELRSPLSAIVGWTSILRGESCNAEDLKEGLEVIDRSTKAQVQLIEDILDISRIVSGKLRLEIQPCDLEAVIRAAMDVVRPAAEVKGIRIDAKLDPSASPNCCDAARIQQVVWNLLNNSIKFTPRDGTIAITLAREGSRSRITVSDTGKGMRREFLPYVFDRFRQADSTTRRKFGGLGLGLSIVQQLVEMHGGTVKARSDGEGKGSTFTVELPIVAVAAPTHGPADELQEPAHGLSDALGTDILERSVRLDGVRIVIVDDEADARRVVAKVLQDAGATVTPAGTVAEAMLAVEKVQPHLLISDIAMPDEDGLDLIRKIRRQGTYRPIAPSRGLDRVCRQGLCAHRSFGGLPDASHQAG